VGIAEGAAGVFEDLPVGGFVEMGKVAGDGVAGEEVKSAVGEGFELLGLAAEKVAFGGGDVSEVAGIVLKRVGVAVGEASFAVGEAGQADAESEPVDEVFGFLGEHGLALDGHKDPEAVLADGAFDVGAGQAEQEAAGMGGAEGVDAVDEARGLAQVVVADHSHEDGVAAAAEAGHVGVIEGVGAGEVKGIAAHFAENEAVVVSIEDGDAGRGSWTGHEVLLMRSRSWA